MTALAPAPPKPERTVNVKDEDGQVKELPYSQVIRMINEKTRQLLAQQTPNADDPRRNIMIRHPRLVAHLICESLGYFCPRSAANAIHHYKDSQPFYCEWYSHMAQWGDEPTHEARLLRIGRERLRNAFENRHGHKGYMAEYLQGRMVILQELAGHGPKFASWF